MGIHDYFGTGLRKRMPARGGSKNSVHRSCSHGCRRCTFIAVGFGPIPCADTDLTESYLISIMVLSGTLSAVSPGMPQVTSDLGTLPVHLLYMYCIQPGLVHSQHLSGVCTTKSHWAWTTTTSFCKKVLYRITLPRAAVRCRVPYTPGS